MENPVVSIAMLAYNHEKYIAQAIESVLRQRTDFAFEIIIGEDCSADGTRAIIEKYEKTFSEIIRPIYQKQNIGFMRNFIESILPACRGKYIAFLETDDYWTDLNKLQKQVDFLNIHMGYTVCGHWTKTVDSDGNPMEKQVVSGVNCPEIFCIEDTYKGTVLHTNSWLMRSECIDEVYKKIRIYSSLPYGDDPLLLLALQRGNGFCIREYMSAYRIHGGGIWTSGDMSLKRYNMLAYYYSIPMLIDAVNYKLLRSVIKNGKDSVALALSKITSFYSFKSMVIILWKKHAIPKKAAVEILIKAFSLKIIGKDNLKKIISFVSYIKQKITRCPVTG